MGYREISEALRDEEEGPTLDFKRDQYKVDGASDQEKAELVKDILAFANAFRRTEAYIFIGTEDVPGGRATVHGINDHIDDAKLQQLVSTKCNRAVDFRYTPLELEGKKVALIEIPLQQRPIYLLKNFGGLQKDVVYIRRGSSTSTATPDEIGRMGQTAAHAPLLSAYLVTGEHDEIFEKSLTIDTTNARVPPDEDFPHYGVEYLGSLPGLPSLGRFSSGKNEKFYVEFAQWLRQGMRLASVRLCVKNTGNSMAAGVKVVVSINKVRPDVGVILEDDLLEKPSASTLDFYNAPRIPRSRDVICQPTRSGWKVSARLGKILAMDEAITEDFLYVGADTSIDVPLATQIFGDDLAKPVSEDLLLHLSVTEKPFSVDDVINLAEPPEEDG